MKQLRRPIATSLILSVLTMGAVALDTSTTEAASYVTLLESNADAPGGSEVFLVSYNSFTDLVNNTFASSTFSQVNVSPGFSVGGLAYDGSQFQVLLESDADAPGGSEVFLVSYNSFTDLVNNTFASSTFSQVNVSPGFSVGGLAAIYDNSGGGNGSVPEPPTAILALIALSVLSIVKRYSDSAYGSYLFEGLRKY